MGLFGKKEKKYVEGVVDRIGYISTAQTNGYFFIQMEGEDNTIYSLENYVNGTVFDGENIYKLSEVQLTLTRGGDLVGFYVDEANKGKSVGFKNLTLSTQG